MRPEWAAEYLNIPFVEHGRERAGADCWGLVRLIFHEQRQIVLPSYAEAYASIEETAELATICRGERARAWEPAPRAEPSLFDVIIFRIKGEPIHVGLALDNEYFIHTMRHSWSVIERWRSLSWRNRVVEVCRYGAR